MDVSELIDFSRPKKAEKFEKSVFRKFQWAPWEKFGQFGIFYLNCDHFFTSEAIFNQL